MRRLTAHISLSIPAGRFLDAVDQILDTPSASCYHQSFLIPNCKPLLLPRSRVVDLYLIFCSDISPAKPHDSVHFGTQRSTRQAVFTYSSRRLGRTSQPSSDDARHTIPVLDGDPDGWDGDEYPFGAILPRSVTQTRTRSAVHHDLVYYRGILTRDLPLSKPRSKT